MLQACCICAQTVCPVASCSLQPEEAPQPAPGRILQVDKLCETKGLDEIDREKAKRHARDQVGVMYSTLSLI